GVERPFLLEALEQRRLIAHAGVRLGGLAVDHEVGRPALAEGAERVLELPLRARGVARAVLSSELLRQARPEPRPEDADDDVGLRRREDLLLEMGRGTERLVLPEDRLDLHRRLKLSVETLEDAYGDEPLLPHVAGGGE